MLTGRGDNFCAGIDVSTFTGDGGGSEPSSFEAGGGSPANFYQSAAYVWREMPVPVIAALKGTVFGAGLQIALGADVRWCRPDAKLAIVEIKWGIVPDMGLTTTLPSLMSLDKALSLTWSGRVVSGSEAAEIGLVTAVDDDPDGAATRFATELSNRSPDAIRASKRLLQSAWADRDAGLLGREAHWQRKVLASPNQREAVMANVQKRDPDFTDPQ